MAIILRSGSWCDVAPATKAWVNGRKVWVNGNVWGAFENPSFLRVAASGLHTAVILSEGLGVQTARVCVNGGAWTDLGFCYGTYTVALRVVGEGFYAAVVVDAGTRLNVFDWWPNRPTWQPLVSLESPVPGTSQGLLGTTETRWLWTDEEYQPDIDRYQLLKTAAAGDMRIGQQIQQKPTGADALIALYENKQYLLFGGLAFEPRIAVEANGDYSIVSRIPGALWIDISGPAPLGQLIVPPVPVPEPPPPAPPPPTPVPPTPVPPTPEPKPMPRTYPNPETAVTEPFAQALREWGAKQEGTVPVESATTAAFICARGGMRVMHDYHTNTSHDSDSVALARSMAKHLSAAQQELGLDPS